MRNHHIGCLVKSIEAESPVFLALGYEPVGEPVQISEQRVIVCLYSQPDSDILLELVEPLPENRTLMNLLEQRGRPFLSPGLCV